MSVAGPVCGLDQDLIPCVAHAVGLVVHVVCRADTDWTYCCMQCKGLGPWRCMPPVLWAGHMVLDPAHMPHAVHGDRAGAGR